MGNTLNRMETLFERVEEFGKTSFELYRLKAIGKTAEVVSSFISRALVILVISISLVFASIGLALWVGDLLGKLYLGFFCVAIFYILLGCIMYYFLHKVIKRKLSNSIISQAFNK